MEYNEIGVYNFSLVQGVDVVHSLFNWEVNGVPFDLESATEVRIDFKRDNDLKSFPILSLTKENLGLKLNANNLDMVFGTNTMNINPGVYLYDVLIVKAGKRYIYMRGQMELYPVITK